MTQHLSEDDVRGMAAYARIGLDEQGLAQMTTEFDLEGVEPTFHPIGSLSNVMREDVEQPSFTQEEALSNAPRQQDGSFLIPSILGEGGDR